MNKIIQDALTITVGLTAFLFFGYGTAAIGYPLFFGAWPISLYYTLLFVLVLVLQVRIGANLLFFSVLSVSILVNFMIFFVDRANSETSREVLFSGGIPTVFGAIWLMALCVGIVMFACGLCELLRDFRRWQTTNTSVPEGSKNSQD